MSLNIKRLQEKIDYGSSGSGGATIKSVTGTFTSPATAQGTIHIDCGFQPDMISVILPINGKNTCSYYDKFLRTDGAYWDLKPFESNIYFNQFTEVTGETGICGIDDTGFTFRAKASTTLNIECTYIAYKF